MSLARPDAGAAAVTQALHPSERPWSNTRRWLCIALVLAAQIGLIFAFGEHKPVVPRRPTQVTELRLAAGPSEWLELDNPTLFALPGREGFSGPAWGQLPNTGFRPFEWSEPAQWLPLPEAQLGTVLSQYMQTNQHQASVFATKLAPKLNLPKSELPGTATDAPSTLRIEGELLQRRLLYPPDLPSWRGTDLLLDTVVQVLVDRAGRVVSTVLLSPGNGLPPGSGKDEADQWALNLARAMEFAPVPKGSGTTTHWTPGMLIFHWQTLPLPATNTPASLP